jgi:hypothetical protein
VFLIIDRIDIIFYQRYATAEMISSINTRNFINRKIMKRVCLASLICLSTSLPVYATSSSTNSVADWWSPSRLYMGAYGGYGNVSGAYHNDGQVAQGRLTLGLHAAEYNNILFGIEAGVQSGNTMRLSASPAVITASGGLPIQSTLKPLLDLLMTFKARLTPRYPLFGIVKGGIAYRQLQLNDRTSTADNLKEVNGELQAGLGFSITDHISLIAVYQGIYSDNNADVSINSADNTTINHIPTQQAGFLGIEYSC